MLEMGGVLVPFYKPLLGRDGVCPGVGKPVTLEGGGGGGGLAGGLGMLWHLKEEPGCRVLGSLSFMGWWPWGAVADPTRHPLVGLGPASLSRGLGNSRMALSLGAPQSDSPWLPRWHRNPSWAALPLPSGEGA